MICGFAVWNDALSRPFGALSPAKRERGRLPLSLPGRERVADRPGEGSANKRRKAPLINANTIRAQNWYFAVSMKLRGGP